jgi:hypothetical protein
MTLRTLAMRAMVFTLAFMMSTKCDAGAWTLEKHHWQNFSGAVVTEASMIYGSGGHASVPTKFSKSLLQNSLEYGLTDRVTLFAMPAFVIANAQAPATQAVSARGSSVEAGVRFLLSRQFGALSVQGSYKLAGAFDLSVSANRAPGRQIDLRLLYGTNFTLFALNGFADFQIGQRWISYPRPNETPVDITTGVWLTPRTLLMAQSFNVISSGDAVEPYSYYRAHKVELSVVEKVSRRWSLQVGAFASPAGQNALVERGVSVALWTQN